MTSQRLPGHETGAQPVRNPLIAPCLCQTTRVPFLNMASLSPHELEDLIEDFNSKMELEKKTNLFTFSFGTMVDDETKRTPQTNTDILKAIVETGTTRDVNDFLEGLLESVLNEAASVPKVQPTVDELLYLAAQVGKQEMVKFMIETKGADVNCKVILAENVKSRHGCFPIESAAAKGHIECLKYLMEKGADVNPVGGEGPAPLVFAASSGSMECVNQLLEAGVDVNQANEWWTPLIAAASCGNVDCVRVLLEHGADVSQRDRYGKLPLMFALHHDDPSCAELLLDAGADVNTSDGCSPLTFTAQYRKKECVKLLLRKGADVNLKDDLGNTPLISAIFEYVECLKLLLDAGADVNMTNDDQQSPLVKAAMYGCAHSVKLLLDSGADVNHNDSHFGSTALICFSASPINWQQKEAVAKLLLAAGANVNITPRHMVQDPNGGRTIQVLLLIFAAGEQRVTFTTAKASDTVYRFIPRDWRHTDLKNQCRKVIRKHLLTLDPHTNLFIRVPQLQMTRDRPGLPDHLVSYLLYGLNLQVDWEQLDKSEVA